MKISQVIIILLILDLYKGQSNECEKKVSDKDECPELGKISGDEYCCFIIIKYYPGYKYDHNTISDSEKELKYCHTISSKLYNDMDKAKEELSDEYYYVDKIKCKSFYLHIGLLSLSLLFYLL